MMAGSRCSEAQLFVRLTVPGRKPLESSDGSSGGRDEITLPALRREATFLAVQELSGGLTRLECAQGHAFDVLHPVLVNPDV